MKVYNVKVEAKMKFHFPVLARDSVEAERIVHELCGVNGGETDDELNLFLGILTDFAEERLSKYGEVSCSNLDLRADIYPERDFMNEEINKIGLFRMHPVEQSRIEDILVLKKHIINYSKIREMYVEYRKAGYSKKFFEEHREAITIHKAAKQAFDELGLKKIPRVKELNEEYYKLMADKKKLSSKYYEARATMQEILKAQKNDEMFLDEEQKLLFLIKMKSAFRTNA